MNECLLVIKIYMTVHFCLANALHQECTIKQNNQILCTSQKAAFEQPLKTWSTLNHIRTKHGRRGFKIADHQMPIMVRSDWVGFKSSVRRERLVLSLNWSSRLIQGIEDHFPGFEPTTRPKPRNNLLSNSTNLLLKLVFNPINQFNLTNALNNPSTVCENCTH